MMIGLLFWALTLVCCAHAAFVGGREGRWACAMILMATLLTVLAAWSGPEWSELEAPRLAVDLGLLIALYILALVSRRYWPIWMTGFHLIAVTTHLSTLIAPKFTPELYRAMQTIWAIPVLLSMVIGISRDRAATGSDTLQITDRLATIHHQLQNAWTRLRRM